MSQLSQGPEPSGMLGKVVISKPEATIAFMGKRVIEDTLNIEVLEGVQ